MVTISVPALSSALMFASSSTADLGFRVLPNAAILACFRSMSRVRSKSSTAFGLEPGCPPSM